MNNKLKQLREKVLAILNELDELIEGDNVVSQSRPIDPPPPDKPKG